MHRVRKRVSHALVEQFLLHLVHEFGSVLLEKIIVNGEKAVLEFLLLFLGLLIVQLEATMRFTLGSNEHFRDTYVGSAGHRQFLSQCSSLPFLIVTLLCFELLVTPPIFDHTFGSCLSTTRPCRVSHAQMNAYPVGETAR